MSELLNDPLLRRVRDLLDHEEDDLTTNSQSARAQAVLARVRSSVNDVPLDHRPASRHRSRVRLSIALPVGVAAAAMVAALVVVGLPNASGPSAKSGSGSRALVTAPMIRARLLAALDDSGGDVLAATIYTSSGSAVGSTCTTRQWIYPFAVAPGDDFREHVENCSDDFASAVDITAESVVPDWLPTPATIGNLQQPGQPASPNTHPFTPRVGVEVCGTGSQIGYDTSNDAPPNDVTWQASSETLHAPAPATPSLLKSELDAGSLQLVGNTTLNGQPAIELSVLSPSSAQVGSTFSEMFWVNPTTYLPMQAVMHWTNKQLPGAPPLQGATTQWDFTFLPPTAANLALLQVTIPAGLTTIPPVQTLVVPSCPYPPSTNTGAAGNSGVSGNSGTASN